MIFFIIIVNWLKNLSDTHILKTNYQNILFYAWAKQYITTSMSLMVSNSALRDNSRSFLKDIVSTLKK